MTSDGKLRHPSFKGLRDDKPATQVVREVPVAPEKTKATASASATGLTHPERVLYADCGLTKQDLAAYYQLVSERMLPHLAGRPLAFVRCPGGTASACFFTKHALKGAAAGVRRLNLREKTTSGEYLVVDRADDLRALVQMSALEIHTWGATEANLDAPDRLVFDLDPGPDVKWPAVVEAAHRVRERLQALGLTSFVKSTGGKGLHVVTPLVPAAAWDRARAFCAQLAQGLTDEDPARYTVAMPKAGRERKILIDYFRNQRGATVVAPYSTRARAGAPVSVPLDWDELDRVTPAHPVTAKSIAGRLASDPWEDYETSRRRLP
jgi:bifunctional non-homologous end joining protein LigD